MQPFHLITKNYYVTSQIDKSDIDRAKEESFTHIFNNRPDSEHPSLSSQDAKSDAAKLGIHYHYAPVGLGYDPQLAISALNDVLSKDPLTANVKILAHCKSGTRSASIWAYAQAQYGESEIDSILEKTKSAGYNLQSMKDTLIALRKQK